MIISARMAAARGQFRDELRRPAPTHRQGLPREPHHLDFLNTAAEVAVPAGATVRLAYFSAVYGYEAEAAAVGEGLAATIIAGDYTHAAARAATAATEFNTFSGRLTAGLANGTVVLNWGTVGAAPPADPVSGDPDFTG